MPVAIIRPLKNTRSRMVAVIIGWLGRLDNKFIADDNYWFSRNPQTAVSASIWTLFTHFFKHQAQVDNRGG